MYQSNKEQYIKVTNSSIIIYNWQSTNLLFKSNFSLHIVQSSFDFDASMLLQIAEATV